MLISDIVSPDATLEENQESAHTPIYLRPFMEFSDGSVYYRDELSITLAEVIQRMINLYNAGSLTGSQLTGFESFWRQFSDVFPEFDFTLDPDSSDALLPSFLILPLPRSLCLFSLTSDLQYIIYEALAVPGMGLLYFFRYFFTPICEKNCS